MQLKSTTVLISTGLLVTLPLLYLLYRRIKSKKRDRLDEEQIVRKRLLKVETPFEIAKDDVRFVIGINGAVIHDIEKRCNVKVFFPQEECESKLSQKIIIKSFSEANNLEAIGLIKDACSLKPKILIENIELRSEYCGKIIGKGGKNIKRIREESGSRIFISKEAVDGNDEYRNCEIEGTQEEIDAAKALIEADIQCELDIRLKRQQREKVKEMCKIPPPSSKGDGISAEKEEAVIEDDLNSSIPLIESDVVNETMSENLDLVRDTTSEPQYSCNVILAPEGDIKNINIGDVKCENTKLNANYSTNDINDADRKPDSLINNPEIFGELSISTKFSPSKDEAYQNNKRYNENNSNMSDNNADNKENDNMNATQKYNEKKENKVMGAAQSGTSLSLSEKQTVQQANLMMCFDNTDRSTESTVTDIEDAVTPTESTVTPTESTVIPTESTVRITESTVAVTESTVAVTESTVATTESTVTDIEAAVTPESTVTFTESTVKPAESTVTPTESTVAVTESTVATTECIVTDIEDAVPAIEDPVTLTESTVTPTESTVAVTESTVTPTESTVTDIEDLVTPTESTASPTENITRPTGHISSDSSIDEGYDEQLDDSRLTPTNYCNQGISVEIDSTSKKEEVEMITTANVIDVSLTKDLKSLLGVTTTTTTSTDASRDKKDSVYFEDCSYCYRLPCTNEVLCEQLKGRITYIPCTNHLWILPDVNQSDATFIARTLTSMQNAAPVDDVIVNGVYCYQDNAASLRRMVHVVQTIKPGLCIGVDVCTGIPYNIATTSLLPLPTLLLDMSPPALGLRYNTAEPTARCQRARLEGASQFVGSVVTAMSPSRNNNLPFRPSFPDIILPNSHQIIEEVKEQHNISSSSSSSSAEDTTVRYTTLPRDSSLVYVSAIHNAGHFYLQCCGKNISELDSLEQDMLDYYGVDPMVTDTWHPTTGEYCAVWCSAERFWVRGQIMEFNKASQMLYAKYVDYGDTKHLHVSLTRKLSSEFKELPFQGVECYLANVVPYTTNQWTPEATAKFDAITQCGQWYPLRCHVMGTTRGVPHVELFLEPYSDKEYSVNSYLCTLSYARSSKSKQLDVKKLATPIPSLASGAAYTVSPTFDDVDDELEEIFARDDDTDSVDSDEFAISSSDISLLVRSLSNQLTPNEPCPNIRPSTSRKPPQRNNFMVKDESADYMKTETQATVSDPLLESGQLSDTDQSGIYQTPMASSPNSNTSSFASLSNTSSLDTTNEDPVL